MADSLREPARNKEGTLGRSPTPAPERRLSERVGHRKLRAEVAVIC
jgi:hypothetical protein